MISRSKRGFTPLPSHKWSERLPRGGPADQGSHLSLNPRSTSGGLLTAHVQKGGGFHSVARNPGVKSSTYLVSSSHDTPRRTHLFRAAVHHVFRRPETLGRSRQHSLSRLRMKLHARSHLFRAVVDHVFRSPNTARTPAVVPLATCPGAMDTPAGPRPCFSR